MKKCKGILNYIKTFLKKKKKQQPLFDLNSVIINKDMMEKKIFCK